MRTAITTIIRWKDTATACWIIWLECLIEKKVYKYLYRENRSLDEKIEFLGIFSHAVCLKVIGELWLFVRLYWVMAVWTVLVGEGNTWIYPAWVMSSLVLQQQCTVSFLSSCALSPWGPFHPSSPRNSQNTLTGNWKLHVFASLISNSPLGREQCSFIGTWRVDIKLATRSVSW